MKARTNLPSWFAIFAGMIASGSVGMGMADVSPPSSTAAPEPGRHYERPVLSYLWPLLQPVHKVARIYYEATCSTDKHYPLPFPEMDVQPPLTSEDVSAAVRSMFRMEHDVTVADDQTGIIRVRAGRVSDAVLQTRIARLQLTPIQQYNVLLAIWAVQNSPEVQSTMRHLDIHVPQRIVDMTGVLPAEGLSHMPSEISDVTMDQALDMIAKTWGGIILYGACSEPAMYEVSYAHGDFIRGS